jgi:Predicted transcriptional regulators
VPVEVLGAHYREIEVSAITPNPRQPRRTFDEEALDELAESIREVGLLQPVVVRRPGPAGMSSSWASGGGGPASGPG